MHSFIVLLNSPEVTAIEHKYIHLLSLFCFLYPQATGFTLEVMNTNTSTLVAGIRILVGSQSIDRAPSYVEVFGRTIPLQVASRNDYLYSL